MIDVAWSEKYRPKTISETILPKSLKNTFQTYVDNDCVPNNLLLCGKQGTGKTTVAKAMLNEIGADYIMINGSIKGNIDTLRVEIQNFASTVSFSGKRKYVILDEADYLNAQSTQPALRGFMEEFSKNCGFILTCNFRNRILQPLQSRCSVIEFKVPKDEQAQLAGSFFKRVQTILDTEGVTYNKKVIAEVIKAFFPDWRRVLNELQKYSNEGGGSIDEGILVNMGDANINSLFSMMKDKKFSEVRKWVAENSDIESSVLYRQVYDKLPEKMDSTSAIAEAIITLAQYQYQEAFVANSEILP